MRMIRDIIRIIIGAMIILLPIILYNQVSRFVEYVGVSMIVCFFLLLSWSVGFLVTEATKELLNKNK